ncbi:MAG TPA: class I SAM-dependent methyltransferase [Candidatus Limnocylindrales bacterium]
MPFQPTFDCLWCGTRYETRSPADVEGWAQLCPACVGRAGENGFLRYRLKAALAERVRADGAAAVATLARPDDATRADPAMIDYYEARAPEYDDWYLRRGRYDRGPIENAVWNSELDRATLWLDRQPLGPVVVELAAGTGWWSPLLAQKGELSAYDAAEGPLDRARSRLVAHGLRAHLHVRDAWAPPERPVDGLFTGFWLSHVLRPDLDAFLRLARSWLRPGGTYAFIDSLPDPASAAIDHPAPRDDRSVRRLEDGREFEIPKIYYRPDELEAALRAAGFASADVTTTGRFFLLGHAVAPEETG